MEEDPRTRKKQGFFGSRMRPREDMGMFNRRVLPTYDLKPPDYYMKPQFLMEEHVEKFIRYAGHIEGVPIDIDITNRTDVLRVIDKGKTQGKITAKVGFEHDAIFSLSVHNIKLSRYNQVEDLLMRIPMHEIAAVCYIKDDGQHILALKHGGYSLQLPGSPDECSLLVLFCETKVVAEELCALINQCFHLIYTDATMQLLNSAIPPVSSQSGSTGGSTTMNPERPSFISDSNKSLNTQDFPPNRPHQRPSRVPSEPSSDVSITADLIKDYMNKLHQKLNPEELRHFAKLLREWYTNLPLGDFCDQVLQLYGHDRKYLLGEMSPFIPSAEYPQFIEFLRKNGIPLPENGTQSSSRSNTFIYARRSVSELSTASTISNGSVDDVETMLNMVTDHIAKLDANLDVDTNPDNYLQGLDAY